jgi:hypothetical protein
METRIAMSRLDPARFPIVLTLLATAPAAAQLAVPLEPVDQMIEDVSVLSTSLREIEPGLRRPNDFSRVYRARGRGDRFMRVQGALFAEFPESVYGTTREGETLALVPDGTTFYIGPPPGLDDRPVLAAPREDLIRGRIDLRVDLRRHAAPRTTRSSPGVPQARTAGPWRSATCARVNRKLTHATPAPQAARGRSSSSSK